MRKFLALIGVAAVLFLVPARADASCCDQPKAEASAVEMLLAMDPNFALTQLTAPETPAVQRAEVWFHRPVRIGKAVLQGRYVIEHDNDRMARGEPCTHIYAYDDQTKPVVTFHCTHIERERASSNTVAVYSLGDGAWQALSEFQFAGDTAAHGVPSIR